MSKSVIIAGGGIAGMSVAIQLAAHGYLVTLVEAKERLGGRMHTVRHGRLAVELGAEFLHGKDKELLRLLHSARLSKYEINSDSHVLVGKRLKPFDVWADAEKIISRIDPQRPDTSFAQFLSRQRLNPLRRQLALNYAEGFNAADARVISAHSILKAQYSAEEMEGDWQGKLKHGYAGLIRYLEGRLTALGVQVLRGTRVTEIRWRRGEADVACRMRGRSRSLHAAAVVVTIPLGIWKAGTFRFRPALCEKQAAVAEMQFGNVMKFSLLFRERWWPEVGNGFIHAPDEAIPTWWGSADGPMLTGWAGGPHANALLTRCQGGLTTLCLEILARIHGERPQRIQKALRALYHHDWAGDPQILGAYSYIPVNGLNLPKVLAAPIAGTLYFAGEATTEDAQMGTVFGAYESGLRVAGEIIGGMEK